MFASKLASYPPQLGRNGLWLSKIYASFHTTIALHHLLQRGVLGISSYFAVLSGLLSSVTEQ